MNKVIMQKVSCILLVALAVSCSKSDISPPMVTSGSVTVTREALKKHSMLNCSGEWELVSGDEISYANAPGEWPINREKSDRGLGEWRITVNNPDNIAGLALLVHKKLSAWRVLCNGEVLFQAGIPGTTRAKTSPSFQQQVTPVFPGDGPYEITIEAATFYPGKISMSDEQLVAIGRSGDLQQYLARHATRRFFLGGLFLAMALLYTVISLLRRKERYLPVMSIINWVATTRLLIQGSIYYSMVTFLPPMLLLKLNYLLLFSIPLLFFLLVHTLLETGKHRIMVGSMLILNGTLMLAAIAMPGWLLPAWKIPFFIISIIVGLVCIIIKAYLRSDKAVRWFVVLMLLLFAAAINDMLDAAGLINSFRLVNMGFIVFLVIISIYIFSLASRMLNTFERLSQNLEKEVLVRTNKLEQATHDKTRFFVNLAHETKTPLTLIRNYLERYIDRHGSDSDILIVKHNIDKLLRDMVNYLDAAKLENDQVFYDHQQITDFSTLLNEKVLIFRESAARYNLDLREKILPGLHVAADPYALDRICNNLLDNAIKFTPSNGIITVTLEPVDKKTVTFSVTDTGCGMSTDKKEHIFDPFYQLNREKRNVEGIGMGMYIVKNIVTSMDGTIEVQSTPGEGTTFTVRIATKEPVPGGKALHPEVSKPLERIPRPAMPVEQPYMKDRFTILLVDDNVEILTLLHATLTDTYNIALAENGNQALIRLESMATPDLVISDVMMPECDGFELFKRTRDIPELSDIPFIFLTARADDEEKLSGLRSGAIDYIYKPFNLFEVTARIESILQCIANGNRLDLNQLKQKISSVIDQVADNNISEISYAESVTEHALDELIKLYGITPREREIIVLLTDGLLNKEIAGRLNISTRTVEGHLQRMYEKCGINTRVELLNLLYQNR
jgi:signal transduction histidine kinase/DNA-binding NarL/FixJ family response regulator